MILKDVPGEYGFRGLIPQESGWKLTENFYLSLEAFLQDAKGCNYFWPVEIQDNGIVYIPNKEELNETE
jgi:hypothetical protein